MSAGRPGAGTPRSHQSRSVTSICPDDRRCFYTPRWPFALLTNTHRRSERWCLLVSRARGLPRVAGSGFEAARGLTESIWIAGQVRSPIIVGRRSGVRPRRGAAAGSGRDHRPWGATIGPRPGHRPRRDHRPGARPAALGRDHRPEARPSPEAQPAARGATIGPRRDHRPGPRPGHRPTARGTTIDPGPGHRPKAHPSAQATTIDPGPGHRPEAQPSTRGPATDPRPGHRPKEQPSARGTGISAGHEHPGRAPVTGGFSGAGSGPRTGLVRGPGWLLPSGQRVVTKTDRPVLAPMALTAWTVTRTRVPERVVSAAVRALAGRIWTMGRPAGLPLAFTGCQVTR
jgi:hypothetical protein